MPGPDLHTWRGEHGMVAASLDTLNVKEAIA